MDGWIGEEHGGRGRMNGVIGDHGLVIPYNHLLPPFLSIPNGRIMFAASCLLRYLRS